MKQTPEFLSLAEVVEIHLDQVHRYGGANETRDLGLLESAIAIPQQTFGGEYLHADLFEMAAAYAFHIIKNHPFVDGNKRTGLASALVFLELNQIAIRDPKKKLYKAARDLANGVMDKTQFAEMLKELSD